MADTAEVQKAVEFANTPRGRFIIGQALYFAIKHLDEIKGVRRETSNIEDMKFLQKAFFPYELVVEAGRKMA